MSPFLKEIVGAIVRMAVVWLAGWLAANANVTLTEDQIGKIVAYGTPVALMAAWTFYQKYVGRQKLLTAQAMRGGVSEAEVEAEVKKGNAPPVNTPRGVAPI